MVRNAILLGAILTMAVALGGLVTNGGIARAGGGCHGGGPAPAPRIAAGDIVTIAGCLFGPVILETRPGTTVRFENPHEAVHGVVGEGWGEMALATGEHFEHRFDASGIYPYACQYHPGMVGAIVVEGERAASEQLPGDVDSSATVVSGEVRNDDLTRYLGVGGIAGVVLMGVVVVAGKRRMRRPRPAT